MIYTSVSNLTRPDYSKAVHITPEGRIYLFLSGGATSGPSLIMDVSDWHQLSKAVDRVLREAEKDGVL